MFDSTAHRSTILITAILACVFTAPALAQKARGVPDRWALLVGVDDYSELTDLKFAGADVRALRDELATRGFRDDQVFVLEDHAAEAKYRPSKRNIEKQLKLVLGLVGEDDVLVVAFSGHGVGQGEQNYFCPSDASLDDDSSMISMEAVYKQLRGCPAALKLLVIDACRDDPRLAGNKAAGAPDLTSPFAQSLQHPPNGLILLASCGPKEISKEDKDLGGGHGVFMHFLLDGLRGRADEQRNGGNDDGDVTINEVARYAARETKSYVARKFNGFQRPTLKTNMPIETLDFALASSASRPNRPIAPDTSSKPPKAEDAAPRSGRTAETDFKKGDYKAAADRWRHAALDDPKNGVIHLKLSQALFATGQFDDAARATHDAMQLLPEDQWGVVVINYRELYGTVGAYTSQMRALEKSVKAKPHDATTRFLLGFHYAYLGYPKHAVKQLDKTLELAPQDELAKKLRDATAAKLPTESGKPTTSEPDADGVVWRDGYPDSDAGKMPPNWGDRPRWIYNRLVAP